MTRINSRTKGHSYERKIVKEWKELTGSEDIWTSRNMSLAMDAMGVDIVGSGIPYHIQCKAVEKSMDLHSILERMPTDKPPIIIHKKNGGREIVVMSKEHFYAIQRGAIAAMGLEKWSDIVQRTPTVWDFL